jgi:serine/threonine protein kinase
VMHVARQVCRSLREAHQLGVIHRDLKPANVFLVRHGDETDFVKVLDFGLVKALDARVKRAAPGLTADNTVQGTPAFIAPEQAMGDADVDGRADIYATGCVAYWLLTGQYVFTADTPIGILLHHASTVPVAPSARTDRPIPPGLERVIMRCLAKNPADRPQTASELSLLLAEVPCGEPWTEHRAREWWTAHQTA